MKLLYTLFLVVFFGFVSSAQDNTLDLTFNPIDMGLKNGDGPYDTVTDPQTYVHKFAIQSDGKILIGGKFTEYNGRTCKSFIRLNSDGTFDTTFNLGVIVEGVQAIVVQPDGKIIVGGVITDLNGNSRKNIVRLNSDGSLDATFNVTDGQESWVFLSDIALQPDGKVLIANSNYPPIFRVDGNGVLDPTFNCDGMNGQINSIALQSDGRLIVGGSFTNFGEVAANRLARINSDGSLDTAFNTSVGANNSVRRVLVLPNDKIAIIGAFSMYNDVYRPLIARLNSDGVLDTTFNPGYFNQTGTSPVLASIALQPDGKLLVGGKYNLHGSTPLIAAATSVNNTVRLNLDGSRDATYSIAGTDKYIYALAVQSNGNIIFGGEFETHVNVARRRISRSLSNGTIDMSFNTGSGANPEVGKVKVLPDNKIIIAGAFRLYNGVVRNRIAKLNADGTLDSSFNSSLLINAGIDAFEIQSDGKIIVGGNFTSIGGMSVNRIARLNSDGSFDYSFNSGSGFNGSWISDIAIQNDGKIIVAGYFTAYNGVTCNRIVRLNTNGSLDTTFNVGNGANDSVSCVAIQSDGKIIVGGVFTTFNGMTKKGILRLNADGSTDASFLSGTGFDGNAVFCIKALSGGKILITTRSQTYNGATIGSMFRLNSDGSRDTTFINVGHSREYTNFIVQPDGKILAINTGSDTLGYVVYYLHRLTANGASDPGFGNYTTTVQFGRHQPVYSLGLQSDGKIIIGGGFNSFKGQGKNRVARIYNTVVLGVDDFLQNDANVMVYEENNSLYIDSKGTILRAVSVYDLSGKLLYENKNISSSKFVLDEIKSNNQVLLFKIIDGEGKVSDLKSIF